MVIISLLLLLLLLRRLNWRWSVPLRLFILLPLLNWADRADLCNFASNQIDLAAVLNQARCWSCLKKTANIKLKKRKKICGCWLSCPQSVTWKHKNKPQNLKSVKVPVWWKSCCYSVQGILGSPDISWQLKTSVSKVKIHGKNTWKKLTVYIQKIIFLPVAVGPSLWELAFMLWF
jgi:hypothetical protein